MTVFTSRVLLKPNALSASTDNEDRLGAYVQSLVRYLMMHDATVVSCRVKREAVIQKKVAAPITLHGSLSRGQSSWLLGPLKDCPKNAGGLWSLGGKRKVPTLSGILVQHPPRNHQCVQGDKFKICNRGCYRACYCTNHAEVVVPFLTPALCLATRCSECGYTCQGLRLGAKCRSLTSEHTWRLAGGCSNLTIASNHSWTYHNQLPGCRDSTFATLRQRTQSVSWRQITYSDGRSQDLSMPLLSSGIMIRLL